ncbi:hypothetical protein BS78_K196100 [Paspalum vaginatum]|uniref:Cytochrome P450 n=1 Tax=Paspalum vaginatum TaxID=158149 RepID=A0A9W8CFR3_9POAL|nr:hypothetical protein BS78_K196100 [Paspalum vaginatum]
MLTDEETPWSLQAAVLLVAFLTISLPVLLNASRHRKQSGLLPPSPWRLPLVGNLHQLGRFPHRSLRSLAAAHGPVMRIHLGMVPAIVVSSADAAREVLQVQDHVFASPPSLSIPSIIFYGCTDLAFAPHGPYWSRLRKLSVNHLLSPSRVRSCAAVREQEVEVLLRRVCGGGVVRLSELLSDFAKDVAGRIVLGTRAAGDEGWRAKLDALLEEIVRMLGSFHVGDCLPWLSWLSAVDGTDARARRAFQSINRILDEIVGDAEREVQVRPPGGETHDDAFLHVLLSMMKEPPQTEGRLIDRDKVKALLVDLFGAGTETMIIVLEWAMAELLCNKGAMQNREGGAAAAPAGAAAAPAQLHAGHAPQPGPVRLRRPQQHHGHRERVGHRQGPGRLGLAGGLPPREVRRRQHGGGLPRPAFRAHSLRLRTSDVPGYEPRRVHGGARARQPCGPLRLGAAGGGQDGHAGSPRIRCAEEVSAARRRRHAAEQPCSGRNQEFRLVLLGPSIHTILFKHSPNSFY